MWMEPQELAEARRDACRLLDSRSEVLRAAREYTPTGAVKETYVHHGVYPCRVRLPRGRSQNGRETQTAGVEQEVLDWEVLLPWDADVSAKDRLRIANETYHVITTDAARTQRLYLVALVSRKEER